jgi:AraC-like DNA-binding protein
MLTLKSEKFGTLVPGNFFPGGEIQMVNIDKPDYQSEVLTVRLESEEVIDFTEIPWPYTLIVVFGYSVVIYLTGFEKKEVHDRGSHLFYIKNARYRIRFMKDRNYIIFSLHFSSDFLRNKLDESAESIRRDWELLSPVFYYAKSRIIKRTTMENISMLMLPNHLSLTDDFIKYELLRAILMDFLREQNGKFQPSYLGVVSFEKFYSERDRLLSATLDTYSISKLLKISNIQQIPLFRKRLRQLYDLNIREFITEFRMTVAIRMLKDPTLSIKEIASKTGFSSAFYFSRVFAEYFGSPPKSFHAKNK